MNPSGSTPNRRVVLLAGQAFTLGLTAVWIAIPASAIFLGAYGSGLLPLTYIGAAVAGAIASTALAVALRRRPLASVAISFLTVLAIVLVASWLLLWLAGATWLSFALLVLVPIVVPLGFMLVVAQAGLLLDVRALKARYARVIAGFALGFVIGGVAGPPLLVALGRTEHLLAGAVAAAGIFIVLVAATRKRFPTELSAVDDGHDVDLDRPTLPVLLRDRYVVLIVGFQMLSAVESQWLDYLVLDRAATRYTDSEDLARFLGRFMAIAYGLDIIFLLLLAGALMRRFGLRYGLTANSGMVLALLGAMIVASTVQGSGATFVFVLIVAARVSDLVLSDGTSRTSLSAAYQAVPTRLRLTAQAVVEGLAVPVAIGLSGLALMGLRASIGTDGLALPILTSVVVAAWVVVALLLYRHYRVNLLANLRHRSLDPAELVIDGSGTMEAIHRLVDSSDERDVRLGLDTLTAAGHPDLLPCLLTLAADERVAIRVDVLDRLVRLDPSSAVQAARRGLAHVDPDIRAASVSALGAVGNPSDVPAIAACLRDDSADVQVAAVSAMTRFEDDAAREQVAVRIESLCSSAQPDALVLAARMLGGCAADSSISRHHLLTMLHASDHRVVNAALAALRSPVDDELLGAAIRHLDDRRTSGASVDALTRGGAAALALVGEALGGRFGLGPHGHEHLARVCRGIGGPDAIAVLRRHVRHRDRDVGLAVMTALAAVVESDCVGTADLAEVVTLDADLEHAGDVLCALVAVQDLASAGPLRSALVDELDLLRRRVLASLSIRYGPDALGKVAYQLAQGGDRAHSLAMEWLDVTLVGIDRAAVSLLEPDVLPTERLAMLERWYPAATSTPHAVLVELVEDQDDAWRRPWIRACALYAAANETELRVDVLARAEPDEPDGADVDDRAQIIGETIEALRRRQVLHHA